LHEDEQLYTGHANGLPVNTFPTPVTMEMLERGQQRFDIYCAVCHGRTGEGNGMIVRRGFPTPPSFHIDRLREAPVGHFVEVINNGYGLMYSYASRVQPADRWAIAAYIRALQLSQHAGLADAPADEQAKLEQEAAR
jgi:mono/diheme cytochrome c family protein